MCCNLVLSPTLSAQAVNALKRQLVMLCNRKCSVLPQEHVDSTRRSRGLVQGHWLVFSKTDRVLTHRHKATNVLFIKQHVSIYKQPMFRLGRRLLPFSRFQDRHSLGSLTTSQLVSRSQCVSSTLPTDSYVNPFIFIARMARLLSPCIQRLWLPKFKFTHTAQLDKGPCNL